MAKTKSPTPQELYQARKQREEQERRAYLPPGLVNHGNTCFMNSVLQGLIATRLLSNLVHFEPIPPEVQRHSHTLLASQRSPQLTNGHELGGQYEQKWDNTMPIGDVFVGVMYRAWEIQRNRRRESLSPKQLLTTLGRKYDQYLDFAQQDAHEFLRILLDAMRMEEFDVIKKLQPPARKPHRRSTITPANVAYFSQEPPEDDESTKLMSLSDMLFGGQLTSILVCQKCKHISQTYEDFNDLSLSIKAEDYAKERKRNKLKNLAKKMGMGGSGKRKISKSSEAPAANVSDVGISAPLPPVAPRPSSSSNHENADSSSGNAGNGNGVRASSVPPSPRGFADQEQEQLLGEARRRSLDGTLGAVNENENGLGKEKETRGSEIDDEDGVVVDASDAVPDTSPSPSTGKRFPSGLGLTPTTPDDKRIGFAEQPKIDRQEKDKDSEKTKEKEKDGWAKFGRRISMTVGLGGGKDKKEKRKSRSRSRTSVDLSGSRTDFSSATESFTPEIRLSRPSLSPDRPQSTPPMVASGKDNEKGTSDEKETKRARSRTHSLSPSSSPSPSPSTTALLMATTNTFSPPFFPGIQRKLSRPPKASRAEEEYLRAILADVTTSPITNGFGLGIFNYHLHHPPENGVETSSSSASSLPANQGLLHSAATLSMASSSGISSPLSPTVSSSLSGGNALWAKLGQLPQLQLQWQLAGVEECLKMFTAVEVLDGENMVGCRRCWKIANGWYEAREKRMEERRRRKEEEAGEEAEEEEKGGEDSDEDNDDDDDDDDEDGRDGDASESEDEDDLSMTRRPRSLSLTSQGDIGGTQIRQSSSAPASPVHDIPSSLSTPSIAMYAHRDASSSFSIASSPANVDSSTAEPSRSPSSPLSNTTVRVPAISTTDMESSAPDSSTPLTARPNGVFPPERTSAQLDSTAADSSVSLLLIPSSTTRHHRTDTEDSASSASGTEDYSSDGDESDTTSVSTAPSASTSTRSVESSTWTSVDHPTPSGESSRSRTSSVRPDEKAPATPMQKSFSQPPLSSSSQASTKVAPSSSSPKSKPKKSKAPKPVIMRPAYKRYLIATPPPILVIHLKRFQQLSKTSMMMSFSSGFKKLDDYVAFPEYLDLTPFLAPKKEDFGLGQEGKGKDTSGKEKKKGKDTATKDKEACMYRLYAVVVHIGNMLGGHYIAYTALPNSGDPGMVPDESVDGSATTTKGPRQWAYISDTVVRLTTLEEVLKAKAYICMYERI